MYNPSNSIRKQRNDLTPYLFHYTKGSDPYQVLIKIISEKRLTSQRGYICFTEAPLTMSIQLFDYMSKYPNALYRPYGIGLPRDLLFEKGARPIIYGTDEDNKKIPRELQWRCLTLEPSSYDYSWLREWRCQGNIFDFKELCDNIILITKEEKELSTLVTDEDIDIDWGYEPEVGTAIPSISSIFKRCLKGISLEKMKLQEISSDGKLKNYIDEQEIGERLD